MTTAAGTARRRRLSTCTRRRKQTPNHKNTMDISSPEVANSHTPATTETISRPSGNTVSSWRALARSWMARPPVEEPGAGAEQPEDHRQPLQGDEGEDLVQAGEGERPRGVRVPPPPAGRG